MSTGKTPDFVSADLGRFRSGAAECIALAMSLGWTVKWQNGTRRTCYLRNDATGKVINVPSTNINANRVKSTLNQILTNTDTAMILAFLTSKKDMRTMSPEAQRAATMISLKMMTNLADYLREKRDVEVPLTQKIGEQVKQQAAAPAPPKPAPPAPPVEAASPPKQETFSQRIVKVTPLKVSQGSVEYESKATEVLHLEGGQKLYRCMICKDYVREQASSVRSHVAAKHPGEARPSFRDPVPTTPPPATPEQPSTHATGARLTGMTLLTHVLRKGMARQWSPRDLAVSLVDLPEQDRVSLATLLLNGKQFEQLRTGAEEAVRVANEERDKALADRDKVRGDLKALRDMLGGLD